ncbi:unnamed protein product [Effrenium voratum]|nr:unnamed protein product [Effrenium voratum]
MAGAERWYACMRRNLKEVDLVAHNSVIGAAAKAGDVERAKLWLQRMAAAQLQADGRGFNSMLDAAARAADAPQAAYDLEQEANALCSELGLIPDEVTYSILMRAWALLGDLPNVDHLWQQMQNRGIQPQACNLWAVLTACARARPPLPDTAAQRYEDWVAAGGATDRHVLSALRAALESPKVRVLSCLVMSCHVFSVPFVAAQRSILRSTVEGPETAFGFCRPLSATGLYRRSAVPAMAKMVKARNAEAKAKRRPSKPQAAKKELVKLRVCKVGRKPHIFREKSGCKGLLLGQAPPGPRQSLPRGWRPLAGPAEQRLARLASLSVQQLWRHFDRANLLAWYPGLKGRAKKHDVARGYKLHTSDGDVFPMKQARMAAAALDLSQCPLFGN